MRSNGGDDDDEEKERDLARDRWSDETRASEGFSNSLEASLAHLSTNRQLNERKQTDQFVPSFLSERRPTGGHRVNTSLCSLVEENPIAALVYLLSSQC